jgi:hypothetical protein
MLPDYADIVTRLGDPLWWDRNGVPRYEPFHPHHCGVYAKYVALLLVTCQNCRREFKVASEWPKEFIRGEVELPSPTSIGSFHYGDPPRHDWEKCLVGDTENSEPRRVLEFWHCDVCSKDAKEWNWHRHPECELEVKEPWVVEGDKERGLA